jgi:hypothetical protein
MDDRVTVTPPESLVKYNAPLFNGIQKDPNQSKGIVENTSKLDEMIHAMLPAREWVEESGIWTQHVSMEPASRLDVITLQVCLQAQGFVCVCVCVWCDVMYSVFSPLRTSTVFTKFRNVSTPSYQSAKPAKVAYALFVRSCTPKRLTS